MVLYEWHEANHPTSQNSHCRPAFYRCLLRPRGSLREHQTKKEQDQVVGAEVLFNGKDLQGWSGDPKFWSVRDGVIYGTTLEHKTQGNTFLCLSG